MSAASERLAAALADRYHLERELGQGGMATVYLAQDLKHDRKVALKVLRPRTRRGHRGVVTLDWFQELRRRVPN